MNGVLGRRSRKYYQTLYHAMLGRPRVVPASEKTPQNSTLLLQLLLHQLHLYSISFTSSPGFGCDVAGARRPESTRDPLEPRDVAVVPAALRSPHSVSPLRRRPGGLRLMEEVQQLPLSELSEGCVGTLGSQRRIASEAALALGAGSELEQHPNFILPINRDAARGINLPDGAVYHDGESCHIPEPGVTDEKKGRTLRPPPFPEQTGRP